MCTERKATGLFVLADFLCDNATFRTQRDAGYQTICSQACSCKKGSDWLKRWVEAQHNIFKL